MSRLWLLWALAGWVWLSVALILLLKKAGRILMTQDEVLAKIAALKTKVEALIAKATAPADLTPLGQAVDAIAAEVDQANPPPAQ